MTYELHIWGPAFGLPSIDPECLAALLYLDSRVDTKNYSVVPSSDPYANPYAQLPALCVSDNSRQISIWIPGYRNIVRCFQHKKKTSSELGKTEQADCTAYTEYIQTRGRELIDLSLWVSSENYTTVTRSAIHELLTWPNSWTLPTKLRDEARARTDHLGLSGLDVDVAAEEQARKDLASQGLDAQIPDRLKKANQTVSRLLGQGNRGFHFKLAALADNFLEMIAELKNKNGPWLLGTASRTSLDCLVLGYLCLMNKAEMPHDWLGFALRERFPRLASWSEEQTEEVFGVSSQWVNGQIVAGRDSRLPWSQRSPRSWTEVGTSIMHNFTASLPLIGPDYLHPVLTLDAHDRQQAPPRASPKQDQPAQQAVARMKHDRLIQGQTAAGVLGLVMLSGVLYVIGIRLPSKLTARSTRDFGAAGGMLGLR